MTRLTSDWVKDMPHNIINYDGELKEKTGSGLRELALIAAGRSVADAHLIDNAKAAVIRINTGEGVIEGFDRAIVSILDQIGLDTITCEQENVFGIHEAMTNGAEILFMADDNQYIAVNTANNKIAENDYCTALGFAAVLEKMSGGLNKKDIALLGYGRVGKIASDILTEKGGKIRVYDKKPITKSTDDTFVDIINDKEKINDFDLIYDATNEGLWLDTAVDFRHKFIVSPGIPLSFDPDKLDASNVSVNDMLQLGTAVMLAQVL